MYSFTSRVRFSETGRDRRQTLASVVDYFQDCSTFQSEDMGLGFQSLESRGLVWVLSYWQIIIEEYPKIGERITVSTHPYDFKGFMGMRNFCLHNEEGRMAAKANSVWTLLDKESLRPVRIPEDIQAAYLLEEKLPMREEPRKIRVEAGLSPETPFCIEEIHLDCNGHVNNGQYIRLAEHFLPEGFRTGQIRAEYRMQARLGDRIHPFTGKQGGRRLVSLCDGSGHPYALAEFAPMEGQSVSKAALRGIVTTEQLRDER